MVGIVVVDIFLMVVAAIAAQMVAGSLCWVVAVETVALAIVAEVATGLVVDIETYCSPSTHETHSKIPFTSITYRYNKSS